MTHHITPPPELVREWNQEATGTHFEPYGYSEFIAAHAAQWGADMELKACCEWLEAYDYDEVGRQLAEVMHAARRPKPPSLKEQALAVLTQYMTGKTILTKDSVDTIRRALEQLDD
jgi:hypothetical protein